MGPAGAVASTSLVEPMSTTPIVDDKVDMDDTPGADAPINANVAGSGDSAHHASAAGTAAAASSTRGGRKRGSGK